MALASLNVSLPREVVDGARTVSTGIFKSPVRRRLALGRLNLEGDGQADLVAHGGVNRAVYVYSLVHYRQWRAELARDDLAPGSFGENFTVEGLTDTEVLIGDRYRVGSALVEVSQPRNPCFKLGLRLGDPQLPQRLVAASRPGFYLRVIEEGEVGTGDDLDLVERDDTSLSVALINDLYWKPGGDRDLLRRGADLAALSPGWRDGLRDVLERPAPVPAPSAAWTGFRPFVVTRIVAETAAVRSLYLAPGDGNPLPAHLPGQAVAVRVPVPGASGAVLRSYTVSQAARPATLRITVKRQGLASTFLHDGVHTGDTLELAAPRGSFTPQADGSRPLALVSAGLGITPMVAMLDALTERGSDRPTWFIHGARNTAELALVAEVADLARAHPNVHTHLALSAPRPGDRCESVGRVDAALVARLLRDPDLDAFVCGPTSFTTSLLEGLATWGVPTAQLHHESFGGPPAAVTPLAPGTGPRIQFARSAVTAAYNDAAPSLLQFAEGLGLTPPYGCRTGICQSCAVPVLDGEVDYSYPPLATPPAGQALLCCSTPRTPLVLDL